MSRLVSTVKFDAIFRMEVNAGFLARLNGVTERNIQELGKNGIIPKEGPGRYILEKAQVAYSSYQRSVAAGQGGKSLTDERTRETKLRADILEVDYARAKSSVIDLETALSIWGKIMAVFKTNIESVGVRMKPLIDQIESPSDKRNAIESLQKLNREALNELSSINSADYSCDKHELEDDETPSESNDEPVGSTKKNARRRLGGRAGKMESKKSAISE